MKIVIEKAKTKTMLVWVAQALQPTDEDYRHAQNVATLRRLVQQAQELREHLESHTRQQFVVDEGDERCSLCYDLRIAKRPEQEAKGIEDMTISITGEMAKALERERKARMLSTIPETIRAVLGEYFKLRLVKPS